MSTPTYCRKKASEYGHFTEKLISKILSEHAMRNLRKAQGILRLGEKYGQRELEQACHLFCRGGAFMNIEHHLASQLKTLRLGGFLETLDLRLKQAREEEFDHLTFLQVIIQDEKVPGRL